MKTLALQSVIAALGLISSAFAADSPIAAAIARGDAADEQLKTPEALAEYLEAEKLGGQKRGPVGKDFPRILALDGGREIQGRAAQLGRKGA